MTVKTLLAKCKGSPIERRLLLAVLDLADEWDVTTDEGGRDCLWLMAGDQEVTITPAVTVVVGGLAYKLDFCIGDPGMALYPDHPSLVLAIELDGHEWHERSKEQAARDRQRDRALLLANIITIRFTGAEVFADAASCAREALLSAAQLERVAQGIWSSGWESHGRRAENEQAKMAAAELEEDRLP